MWLLSKANSTMKYTPMTWFKIKADDNKYHFNKQELEDLLEKQNK